MHPYLPCKYTKDIPGSQASCALLLKRHITPLILRYYDVNGSYL